MTQAAKPQPLCSPCFRALFNQPPTGGSYPAEKCCMCGNLTNSGIYVTLAPHVVNYPKAAP